MAKNTRLSPARRVALFGMVTALTVLFLYAAETVPYLKLICCFMAGLFICIPVTENLYGGAWLCFFASVLIGFFLLPSRICWFFYVAIVGHYGIVRGLLYRNIQIVWLRTVAMVVYSNLGVALGCVLLYVIAGQSIFSLLTLSPILAVLLAEIGFFLLDLTYGAALKLYERRIRRWLIR